MFDECFFSYTNFSSLMFGFHWIGDYGILLAGIDSSMLALLMFGGTLSYMGVFNGDPGS